MATQEQIASLVRAGLKDKGQFIVIVNQIIAHEKSKNHYALANRLQRILHDTEYERVIPIPITCKGLCQKVPQKRIEDLVLTEKVKFVIEEVIKEQENTNKLRENGIEPRSKILLTGPPGNGKTSLAEALAERLSLPFFTVNYSAVIRSYLGETAKEINDLLKFVSSQRCILFFDEFDIIGQERNTDDVGEMKRIVGSLLMQIENIPSHVVVVVATNHSEMLDRAVWRRFQVRLELGMPTEAYVSEYLIKFLDKHELKVNFDLKRMFGRSYSDLEEFCLSVHRKQILYGEVDIEACLAEMKMRAERK